MLCRGMSPARTLSVDNSLYRIAMLLSLAVPVALILGRGLADGLMGVVSLLFVGYSAYARSWEWIKTKWFLWASVTCAYMILSALCADFDKAEALQSAVSWYRFPLFAMAFSAWILPPLRTQKYLAVGLILLLTAVAIDTLWQFHFGTSLSGRIKPDYQGRLTGPFNKMVAGVYLERLVWPAIGFAFAWAMRGTKDVKRMVLAILFAAFIGITILITGERFSLALFGLGTLLFMIGARGLRVPLAITSVVGAVTAIAMIFLVPTLHERIVSNTGDIVSNLSRSGYVAVWTNGLIAWKRSPVMGIGLANYVPMCEQLGKASGFLNENRDMVELKCTRHPHNIYIEWLAATGVIGLALFVGLIGLWVQQVWTRLRAAETPLSEYYVHLGCAVALATLIWPVVGSMSFFSNFSAILFWWVVGIILAPKHA